MKKKSILKFTIVASVGVSIIMYFIYVINVGMGLSSNGEDYGYFGSYISSAFTLITISILLLTQENQRDANTKSIKKQDEMREETVLINKRAETLKNIDSVRSRIDDILNQTVKPADVYDALNKIGCFNDTEINSLDRFKLYLDDSRNFDVESMLGNIKRIVVDEKLDNEDESSLYINLKNILESDVKNFGIYIKDLSNELIHLNILMVKLSKLKSDLIEVVTIASKYSFIVNLFHRIGYLNSVINEYYDEFSKVSNILPSAITINYGDFPDVESFLRKELEKNNIDYDKCKIKSIRKNNDNKGVINVQLKIENNKDILFDINGI